KAGFRRRASVVPTTKSGGRAGLRHLERATRDAAIPDARAWKSSRRVRPRHHRLQPDADVATDATLRTLGTEQSQTPKAYDPEGKQMNHEVPLLPPPRLQLPHRLVYVPSFLPLQPNLQICPFVFNHFHDAPPATLFFSWFCIVAGGGYTLSLLWLTRTAC